MAIHSYTLTTLWHDRQRFLPGVLAVTFSAVLINLQSGLLLGLFSTTSIPIDHAAADIWLSAPGVLSVDLGRPVSQANNLARLACQGEVEAPEILLLDYSYWFKPDNTKELCIVIGSRLVGQALGAVQELTPELRARLSEPGAIVVDEAELGRLGIRGVGDHAKIGDHRVRVVGLVRGLKSLTGPYVFCSIETARQLLSVATDQATYLLARCREPATASAVVERLGAYTDMSAFTREDFSRRTRVHWLTETNAGISTAFTAALGLLVGAVVTSQSLYAAMAASMREYAVLRALGIPRRQMVGMVMAFSFWIGVAGIVLALPFTFGLARVAEIIGTRMLLPHWLLGLVMGLTLIMALGSGLAALRSLRLTEPAHLLR